MTTIIEAAISKLGYTETGNNDTMYGKNFQVILIYHFIGSGLDSFECLKLFRRML